MVSRGGVAAGPCAPSADGATHRPVGSAVVTGAMAGPDCTGTRRPARSRIRRSGRRSVDRRTADRIRWRPAVARSGADADSVKRLYHRLTHDAVARPADFVVSEAGLISVGQVLLKEGARSAVGLAVLELAVERSPGSYRAREALAAGYEKVGKTDRAMAEYREALRLSPQLAKISASKVERMR